MRGVPDVLSVRVQNFGKKNDILSLSGTIDAEVSFSLQHAQNLTSSMRWERNMRVYRQRRDVQKSFGWVSASKILATQAHDELVDSCFSNKPTYEGKGSMADVGGCDHGVKIGSLAFCSNTFVWPKYIVPSVAPFSRLFSEHFCGPPSFAIFFWATCPELSL